MSNYFQSLLDSGKIIRIMDERTIITDRMGPWSNQCLTLAWEDANGDYSISPDEAEILFNYGRLQNVQRIYDGTICPGMIYSDIRQFNAAIVCGTISPSNTIRQGILDYAKSKGYITPEPVPVEMFSGTKYLTCNSDGTYTISYVWSDELKKTCNPHHLNRFTEKYFDAEFKRKHHHFADGKNFETAFYKAPQLTVLSSGFEISNLLEKEVFSRENIDAIRSYDIQVGCLSTKVDKNILLKALIQAGFVDSLPINLRIKYDASLREKHPQLSFPLYQYNPQLSKDNLLLHLQSGDLIYMDYIEMDQYSVSYHLKVPYSEKIRTLMKNFATLMEKTHDRENCRVWFSPNDQSVRMETKYEEDPKYSLCGQFEKELVTLDYAISLVQKFNESNSDQLIYDIMCYYASDTTFPYQELFSFYFSHLESNLKEDNNS